MEDEKFGLHKKSEIRCPSYTGVTCIDGGCPKALQDEYREYGIPVVYECSECMYYHGCEDCALLGTEYCEKNGKEI